MAVDASFHSKESILAPILAPAILYDPIVDSILASPSHQHKIVIGVRFQITASFGGDYSFPVNQCGEPSLLYLPLTRRDEEHYHHCWLWSRRAPPRRWSPSFSHPKDSCPTFSIWSLFADSNRFCLHRIQVARIRAILEIQDPNNPPHLQFQSKDSDDRKGFHFLWKTWTHLPRCHHHSHHCRRFPVVRSRYSRVDVASTVKPEDCRRFRWRFRSKLYRRKCNTNHIPLDHQPVSQPRIQVRIFPKITSNLHWDLANQSKRADWLLSAFDQSNFHANALEHSSNPTVNFWLDGLVSTTTKLWQGEVKKSHLPCRQTCSTSTDTRHFPSQILDCSPTLPYTIQESSSCDVAASYYFCTFCCRFPMENTNLLRMNQLQLTLNFSNCSSKSVIPNDWASFTRRLCRTA